LKILAIETGTEACSAALLVQGEVQELYQIAPREHANLILPFVDRLLGEAQLKLTDLDALAVGQGPGSFTGVRIGASVAQGLAFGADIGIVPVSSLAALAQDAQAEFGHQTVVAALDARMAEVYLAAFGFDQPGYPRLLAAERVCPPRMVSLNLGRDCLAVGSGFASYREALTLGLGPGKHLIVPDRYPRARAVAHLAIEHLATQPPLPAEQFTPVYLRDRVAQKPSR